MQAIGIVANRSCDIGRLSREGYRLGGATPVAASGEAQLPGGRASDGRSGGFEVVLTRVGAEMGELPRDAPVCCLCAH